ncbi:MAG: hypothetical protein COV34_02705 [Candidatus Zambryskibacteria bacterium CG10_big_fil_rev_8_21_14_0_10_42_12]|uniref:Acriflavin resistance protein n=1 Tax=Candidatus Zambryskibacteria bacterium CG10_big_fil_rev_8_21_14_0_10_42_12 TaxID=1975115 RepID=A0A2H0QUL8_9BACT|nr:MAG: hypothetical protein COV34_02705 [Candidatus Zambryskibacteria bacterium CG10_big_fil_rev_8_21_14_0_10_42_12]
MESFWGFFTKRERFSYMLMAVLIGAGFYAMIAIPKESAPEVQVPVAIVTTVFPGANASDVELLVTNKLEERLFNNLEELNKLNSTSREGVSVITVEFNADASLDKSIAEVKDEVDAVTPELPTEAEDPFVSEVNFVDQPILTVSVSTDLPTTEFIELSEQIESNLKSVRGVSRVERSGLPDREVTVFIDSEALVRYGLSLSEITSTLSQANASLPVGSIAVNGVTYAISFEGGLRTPEEVASIPVGRSGNATVYMRDIATISTGTEAANTLSRVSVNGEPSEQSATFSIFKRRGGDITRITEAINEKIGEMEGSFLSDATVLVSYDTGEYVKDDLRNLSFSGLQTVGLVIIVLLLFLGWKEAIIAGLAIPLSFLVAFIGLYLSGNTINFVSLFSLILAVGILVDSAIVVTEAIHTEKQSGKSGLEAALATIKTFGWPLISGTATTIAVFAPLFIVSGVTGEFIASIPFTIIFVLAASLFVALAFVPLIASHFLHEHSPSPFVAFQEKITKRITEGYHNIVHRILGDRDTENVFLLSMAIMFVVAFALPIVGGVQVIFFPQEDIDFIYVEAELPEGSVLSQTDLVTRRIEEVLYNHEEIDSFVTTVGAGSAFGSAASGERFANQMIILRDDRKKTSTEVVDELREMLAPVSGATIRVSEPSGGPPTGKPVAIKFYGENLDDLSQAVSYAETVLESVPGATQVENSFASDGITFKLDIDRDALSRTGLSPQALALALRTAIVGINTTTINQETADIDVIARLNITGGIPELRDIPNATIDDILAIPLKAPNGTILLGSVARVSIERSNTSIVHEDRKRVATVSSDVIQGSTPASVVKVFEEKLDVEQMPAGITYSVGGENEEVNKSFRDMFIALIIGFALILAILVLQFNSYKQAFIIISIIPLSLIGVLFGLAIVNKPISFPSIMGFIALSGIVVNNSIILIDVMNNLRKEHPEWSSDRVAVEGATLRLRPILLTTLTTVIGIIPLTYASGLWGPLAYSIMFGLSFATVVTLILVPILYGRWQ